MTGLYSNGGIIPERNRAGRLTVFSAEENPDDAARVPIVIPVAVPIAGVLPKRQCPILPKLKCPIPRYNAPPYREGKMAEEDRIIMSQKESNRLYVIHQTLDKAITQDQAAGILGLTDRQVRDILGGLRLRQ